MTHHEEERTRLKRLSSKQAIALAMEGRWREAVEANESLIESFANDVDACNRLGRAHMELGEYSLSRKAYEKALEINPYNIIAQKNINRLSHLVEVGTESNGESVPDKVEPKQFIEEVGKAGVVDLRRLAPPEILAKTVAGSRVNLEIEGRRLVVENGHGEYLGQVEPKHGQRLIKLMEGGNRYTAVIISSTEDTATVIIREVYQHPGQSGQPSFPSRGPESPRTYIGDRLGDMIIRRQLEYQEALPEDSGYAIINGEEVEYFSDDSGDDDDDIDGDD
jgi:tetratricopeptide (TPR) repeat protein